MTIGKELNFHIVNEYLNYEHIRLLDYSDIW
jgi:hypothetical protein